MSLRPGWESGKEVRRGSEQKIERATETYCARKNFETFVQVEISVGVDEPSAFVAGHSNNRILQSAVSLWHQGGSQTRAREDNVPRAS